MENVLESEANDVNSEALLAIQLGIPIASTGASNLHLPQNMTWKSVVIASAGASYRD